MAKALKVIGIVAGAVALVATGLGAFGVPVLLGASTATIAGIAGVVAGVANFGSAILTKPPPARGSVTQVLIGPNAPSPYPMGEGYVGGVIRYDEAYGATLNGVPNPYRFMVSVFSVVTAQALTPYVDLAAIGSYYTGFLYTDTQLGATPEADSLAPQWSGAPGWGAASKLSGHPAVGWSLKFDKDGKRFAGGVPPLGAHGQWAKVYDPRLDSTRPGGSGAHRITNEATWAWSANPALHAATYAYGRYQGAGAVKVMGMGVPDDAFDWANVAAWASVCDANGWTLFGVVYEGGEGFSPEQRWGNLIDICAAGGGVPVLTAAGLSFHYDAPRVALDTVTVADLVEDDCTVVAMASWRDRLNTIVPKYQGGEDHNWELVAADPVSVSTLVTEDGETKSAEWPFNFVPSVDQAAQLARYKIENSRELQPIEITVGPRLFGYRPGECLDLDLLDFMGLDGPAVILRRSFDPAKLAMRLTLMGETPGKHAFALGQTGTPPATPALGQTAEERDAIAAAATLPVRGAFTLRSSTDDFPTSATDVEIFINAFDAVLDDGRDVSFPADSVASLASSTKFGVFWHLTDEVYSCVAEPAAAAMADSALAFIGWQATSDATGTYPATDPPPAGYGGTGPRFYNEEPV